jgi:hypothetical protein
MQEKSKNIKTQRRHSITMPFTSANYFKYDKIEANEIFTMSTFSPINNIFKVKSLNDVQSYLTRDA